MGLLGQRNTKDGSRAYAANSLSDNDLPTVNVPAEQTEIWIEETGRDTKWWERTAKVLPDLVNAGSKILGGDNGTDQTNYDSTMPNGYESQQSSLMKYGLWSVGILAVGATGYWGYQKLKS